MDFGIWWPVAVLLAVATISDIRTRRIPNWATLPYLVAGTAVSCTRCGGHGLKTSAAGVLVAILATGCFWLLRGMGLGDVKLSAAIGAWIGPQQTLWMLFAAALAGGIIALGYAGWHGSLGKAFAGTGDLIRHFARGRATRHRSITLDNAGALSIPYAPAIAIGTLFSFLMK